MPHEIKVGSIVISRAGRDKGEAMIVIALKDDDYALVANGKSRKIANAKLKKLKHLSITNKVSNKTIQKLHSGENPTDKMLREELKFFIRDNTERNEDKAN